MDVPPQERLVVLHNLSQEKLSLALQLGGLPVPSLGVAKALFPYTAFGEITLIGHRFLVDPATVPVYACDAFTPSAPRSGNGHILPAKNAAEAVKRMTSRAAQRRRGVYGTARLLADALGCFVSMEALQAARNKVVRPSQARQHMNALDTLLDRFVLGVCQRRQSVRPGSAVQSETSAMRALLTAHRRGTSRRALADALRRRHFHPVTDELMEVGMEILYLLPRVSSPYFEAKPPRLVAIKEFAGAVAPRCLPNGLREILSGVGLRTAYYDPRVDPAYSSAIKALAFKLADEASDLLHPVTTSRILFKGAYHRIN